MESCQETAKKVSALAGVGGSKEKTPDTFSLAVSIKREAMKREYVVNAWVRSGIRDFCLYYELDDRWYDYNAFFLHQGLEKLCKAYLLGARSFQYRDLSDGPAREKVEKMAKKLGHDLLDLLHQLDKASIVSIAQLNKPRSAIAPQTGRQVIEVLQKAYEECRYPLPPSPSHRKFPVKGKPGWFHYCRAESGLRKVVCPLACQILSGIKSQFTIDLGSTKASYNAKMDDRHWTLVTKCLFGDSRRLQWGANERF